MSTVVRTNRATNPNAAAFTSGFQNLPGTGGTSSVSHNTGVGYDGTTGFVRTTWTVGTSAISGGIQYNQTGLSAATLYCHSIHVKASKTQTMRLTAQYQNSSSVNVGSVFNGTGVAMTAGTWYRLFVTGTSGAAVDRVVLKAEAMTGGANWANGDTLDSDCIVIETGSSLLPYFDGDYQDGAGTEYLWTGAVDASTSTASTYIPTFTLLDKHDAPCDRVEITVQDLQPSVHNITIWRTVDGRRAPVRGVRKVDVVGSDFFVDYEAPLGRLITYEMEILSGFGYGGDTEASTITLTATSGWMQDPLDPGSAIPLLADDPGQTGEAMLMDASIKKLEYTSASALFEIVGTDEPVALLSNRRVPSGIPFVIQTNAESAAADIRALIKQTPLVLVRPLAEWAAGLPGACYTAAATIVEAPINEAAGGDLIEWRFETPLVAPPTMKIVIPAYSYEDWQAEWTTYQQAQTALTGDTYLAVKKSPTG